jgi:DMSO/TMAO reductase YedYZ heme-binding membrane subunit
MITYLFLRMNMELTKETDQALVAVVFILTGIVSILDFLTPSEISVWSLYLVPLGFSRWSDLRHLTMGIAVLCTSLIICAHLFNPGATHDIAIINRVLGILMIWVAAFFLKIERL